MNDTPEVVYRLDAEDRIAYVNAGWEQFARENMGETLAEGRALRCSLWDFIGDDPTRRIYREIISTARKGQEVEFVLRCDAPENRRLLSMKVSPAADGGVEFRTRTLAHKERSPQPLLQRRDGDAGTGAVRGCGWCNRVEVRENEWVEVEEAMERLHLTGLPVLPRLTREMCPHCSERMLSILDRLRH